METITKIVKAWIVGEDKKEETNPFVPIVTWPGGTEKYSDGPFLEKSLSRNH